MIRILRGSLRMVTLLLVLELSSGVAMAEDAPPPPLAPAVERFFPELDERLKTLPPFFRDADVFVNFRTYYFNRHKPDDTDNEALATGGWLGFRSGWLLDMFAVGATLYGSAPPHASPGT